MGLSSKEVPVNISYPIIVDPIDGYFDARISPSSVIYIIKSQKYSVQNKDKIEFKEVIFVGHFKTLMVNGKLFMLMKDIIYHIVNLLIRNQN